MAGDTRKVRKNLFPYLKKNYNPEWGAWRKGFVGTITGERPRSGVLTVSVLKVMPHPGRSLVVSPWRLQDLSGRLARREHPRVPGAGSWPVTSPSAGLSQPFDNHSPTFLGVSLKC